MLAVRNLIDLRLTVTQDDVDGPVHAVFARTDSAASSESAEWSIIADSLADGFDSESFSNAFLGPLRLYAIEPVTPDTMRRGGLGLANLLFPGSVRSAFLAELKRCTPQVQLRLRLDIRPPSIGQLPFEYTFLDAGGGSAISGFLALLPNVHVVREVDAARANVPQPEREADARPTRVLAVSADPSTHRYPALANLESEIDSLTAAFQRVPEVRRSFQFDVLRYATPESLRRQLADARPHILHFVGHADYGPTGPFLVLLGENGEASPLHIDRLAESLASTPNRLVVVSACGSPSSVHRLADTLIRSGGADAVVAMQFALRDSMARPFSRALYSALAEGSSVEECVWQARQAVQGAGADWGIPVVYRSAESMDRAEKIPTGTTTFASTPAPEANGADLLTTEGAGNLSLLPELERPFIGRKQDVEEILQKVRSREQRLVTITGIGGMGKTTLAIHCAQLLRHEFPNSLFFVSLDALDGRDAVVSALCAVFDIEPSSAARPELALIQGIRKLKAATRIVLVIDCFETHIAQASLVDSLLTANSSLSCIVTSRIVLGLPQEFQYPLDPMSTAPLATAQRGQQARVRRLDRSDISDNDDKVGNIALLPDSVSLFREAARHVQPNFEIDSSNEEVIGALCQHLEGVPLALVLAASRLRHLSVDDLLSQVRSRPLKILRRRRVGVESADRHADLQEVIAGSFALLDRVDREALQQFGVFVGGFSVDAALAVCDPEPDGDVLDSLSRLREHSLVQADWRTGSTRYRLLDTVREYVSGLATDSKTSGDSTHNDELVSMCRRRHAQFFLKVAQRLRADIRRTNTAVASSDFWVELGNLRAAIAFATDTGNPDILIAFADELARLFAEAGLWEDFDALTTAAQAAHARVDEPLKRLRLLAYRAQMARRRGAETEARSLLERIRDEWATRGDCASEADTLFELASQARDLGELDRTQHLLADAERLAAAAGLIGIVSNARALQASVAWARGDRDRSDALATESIQLLAASSDRDNEIFTCVTVGQLWRDSGELVRAEPILLRALQASLDGARTFGASRALLLIGQVYEAQGRLRQSTLAYLAAERLHADLDARRRLDAAATLRRFRRIHKSMPDVTQSIRAARGATWGELSAQLLFEASKPR